MSSRETSEAGFTYIETLIALMIVSTLFAGVLLFIRGAWSSESDALEGNRELRSLLVIDLTLRRAAARIRPPYWLIGPETRIVADSLTVDWLDGREEQGLTLVLTDGNLLIDFTGAGQERLTGTFIRPGESVLSADNEGISLSVTLGGEEIVIHSRWGGRSIDGEE